jgi:O-methyltransferase
MNVATENDRYIDLIKNVLCASLYDESAWQLIDGPMKTLPGGNSITSAAKRWVVKTLRGRHLRLVRTVPFSAELRQSGLDWPMFGYTMTGRNRLDALERCLHDVLDNSVPGDIAETGVWRGGSMMLAKAVLNERGDTARKLWLADSFEGMPVPRETDKSKSFQEDFSDRDFLIATQEQVQANFKRFGLLDDNVKFLKGWFCDTLPTAPIKQLALLRLDGDLYESTVDALTALYPKLSVGGYLIVDDYHSWPGCKRAVDEYREAHGISDELVNIDAHSVYWKRTV